MQTGAFVLEAAFVLGVVAVTDPPAPGFRSGSEGSAGRYKLWFLGLPCVAVAPLPCSSFWDGGGEGTTLSPGQQVPAWVASFSRHEPGLFLGFC